MRPIYKAVNLVKQKRERERAIYKVDYSVNKRLRPTYKVVNKRPIN